MKRNIIFSILFTYIFWGCSGSSSSHSDEHEHQHSDHIEALIIITTNTKVMTMKPKNIATR